MSIVQLPRIEAAPPPAALVPLAPRAAAGYALEIVAAADLERLKPAWRDLARRSIEPNAFYTPDFAIAAIRELADVAQCRVAAVWRTDRDQTSLVALMPFAARRGLPGLPTGRAMAMTHNYGPLGVPLLDRRHGRRAAEALLRGLASRPIEARFLVLPALAERGPAAEILVEAADMLRLETRRLNHHQRAFAVSYGIGSYLADALSRDKRRELARQRRRLEEVGRVTFDIATRPALVDEAVEVFLSLEASGWKGRAGTATLGRADRAAFVREAVLGSAQTGSTRVQVMRLDGRPIAAAIAFVHNDRGFFWKVAYDEAFARFSPGVQLALAVTEDLLSLPGVRSLDSVAAPGHPMIDNLWRERLDIADWLIDLNPGVSPVLDIAAGALGLQRGLRDKAAGLVRRLRRRHR